MVLLDCLGGLGVRRARRGQVQQVRSRARLGFVGLAFFFPFFSFWLGGNGGSEDGKLTGQPASATAIHVRSDGRHGPSVGNYARNITGRQIQLSESALFGGLCIRRFPAFPLSRFALFGGAAGQGRQPQPDDDAKSNAVRQDRKKKKIPDFLRDARPGRRPNCAGAARHSQHQRPPPSPLPPTCPPASVGGNPGS